MSVTVRIEMRCVNMADHVRSQIMPYTRRTPACDQCRVVRVTTVTEELPQWQAPGIQFDSTIEPSRTRDRKDRS